MPKPESRDENADSPAPLDNETLADQIQQEWQFKLRRMPENIIIEYNIVLIVLLFLQGLLIESNHVRELGYWEAFINMSTQYREAVTHTKMGKAAYLDSRSLDPYSLWQGWVVPSILAGGSYIIVALISLRHELYHWKPELLGDYLKAAKESKVGQHIPAAWLDFIFHIYEDNHRAYVKRRIQKRSHIALEDSKEFFKVLRVVGFNIFISSIAVLVLWISLLQVNIEATNIVKLPLSYVPPIQFAIWYFINDIFYYWPHRIAHTTPTNPLTKALYKIFNPSHKLHHKTKANLGIAAWYCSPLEQILFNLFPALLGPFLTQLLASTLHTQDTWGTHLVTLYIWLMAASANSVLAHTGYRSAWNDPGKHDLHHERAFNPKTAVNFGTLGFCDWLHGTKSEVPERDRMAWWAQRDRQAALWAASKRSGVALTEGQRTVVEQPDHSVEWVDRSI